MRDVLDELGAAWGAGDPVALATVVATWNSAPRQPGAAMLVHPDGRVVGSVSGGCVEGAVHTEGLESLETGVARVHRYGVSDGDAVSVGLTCGGTLEIFVERVDRSAFPQLGVVLEAVTAGRPVAVCTIIEHPDPALVGRRVVLDPEGADPEGADPEGADPEGAGPEGAGPEGADPEAGPFGGGPFGGGPFGARDVAVGGGGPVGTTGVPRIDEAVAADATGLLAAGRSGTLTYGPDGERLGTGMRVFVSCLAPRPRLIVFGAVDFAAAVARIGTFLGFRVSVCDARATFATQRRFPEADEVVVAWPHRYLESEAAAGRIDDRTVITVLTHDPKFDVPLLAAALRLPAVGYVGAMGSRRTHDDRVKRLIEAGFTEEQCARIHSPIGLDLGGRTPEETAVSIAAEIVAQRWGGGGASLDTLRGPIHALPPPPTPPR